MSLSEEQKMREVRQRTLDVLAQTNENSTTPHIKRQLLRAECSLLENEIFSETFRQVSSSSP